MKQCPSCNKILKDSLLFCPYDGDSLVQRQEEDKLIGTVLDDKYRLEEKVGQGGMGKVYRATHIQMDHTVAVKILDPHLSSDRRAVERFRQEAHAAAYIKHPNVVGVTDFGVTKDTGIAYLVMEFLEGVELREKIKLEKQLDFEESFIIVHQACLALSSAHSKGIIHRDLKPDNIWLIKSEDGIERVKVLDFGIAKLKTPDVSTKLTQQGMVIGTPQYMSPEQCRGEELDSRSDLYSLGVIIYEMLTGQLPFDALSPMGIVLKHTTEPPRPLRDFRPDIPSPIQEVVLRALKKEPRERHQSALEMTQQFEAALYASGIELKVWGATTGQSPIEWGRSEFRTGRPFLPDQMTSPSPPLSSTSPNQAASTATAILESDPKPLTKAGAPALPTNGLETTYIEVEPQPPVITPVTPKESFEPPTEIVSKPQQFKWQPLAIIAAAVALFAVLLVFLLMKGSDYTLVLKDAPAGSEVFLNGESRGVVPASGELSLSGLEAGKPVELLVRREGYLDLKQQINAESGTEQVISAQFLMISLPKEIDFKGSMVLIPASDFIMGSDNGLPDEKPARSISASELPDFYIDKYEVTNRQYKEFCDATGHAYPIETPTSKEYFFNNPDSPVRGVSWFAAEAYAQWAGKRLPTEEEWEKAASWDPSTRKKRQWPWGDEKDEGRANFTGRPSPVGSYPRGVSAYGVHDMAGNVAEWVKGFYQPYPGNQSQDPDYGTQFNVARGGGFRGPIDSARTTFRDYHAPGTRARMVTPTKEEETSLGFRCAASSSDPALQDFLRSKR
jgi:serine/threonine-protein kinase